ncbi:sulfatase family protein [Aestuariivivens sediminicola]|uniref:sulfatase family protein n=1 Tax=Aestuariivivens sediminicola TaxID=2913560 RepID=UPI001F56259F|nr:sulfatase [Aestuariivivens sediminicola]
MKKIAVLFVVILFITLSSCKTEVKTLPPPNIVWVVSEDNSVHYMDMYVDDGAPTPNIESLAENGLVFTHAFSNAPVCSAARSTIISGCYGPRLASHYHRKVQLVPMPEGLEMFPAYLRKAGYYTTNHSKEDYNFVKSDTVWNESSNKASWRNRAKNQPFFHVYNNHITHEGGLHFNQDVFEKQRTKTDLEAFAMMPTHPETDLFRYTNAVYRDKIVQMDSAIGKVIDQIKEDGLYDSTFIFYYGDHGGVLPGSKGYLYETGLHVPLVVHVPEKYKHLVDDGFKAEVDGFVSFVDLAPTVLNLAGVAIPEKMDGNPFLGEGVLADEVNSRDEAFSYADRFDEKYDMVRALRKGKYKYIRNYQSFNFDGLMNVYRYKQLAYQEWADMYEQGRLNAIQSRFFEVRPPEMLFDLEQDPFETNNLARDPDVQDLLNTMRGRLKSYITDLPDLSFYPEYYLIQQAFDNPEQFGQEHREQIVSYMHIADLSLRKFNDVKTQIIEALQSSDTWERYWGLIVCSNFGEAAGELSEEIRLMAKDDKEPINRLRALEYMGLYLGENTLSAMADILYQSTDKAEALLILNSMVLLTDGMGHQGTYEFEQLPEEIKTFKDVRNRLDYLSKY